MEPRPTPLTLVDFIHKSKHRHVRAVQDEEQEDVHDKFIHKRDSWRGQTLVHLAPPTPHPPRARNRNVAFTVSMSRALPESESYFMLLMWHMIAHIPRLGSREHHPAPRAQSMLRSSMLMELASSPNSSSSSVRSPSPGSRITSSSSLCARLALLAPRACLVSRPTTARLLVLLSFSTVNYFEKGSQWTSLSLSLSLTHTHTHTHN